MGKRMRALGERAAARCENATTPKCRCRCGGMFHGARRMPVWSLPTDDFHHPKRRPGTKRQLRLAIGKEER